MYLYQILAAVLVFTGFFGMYTSFNKKKGYKEFSVINAVLVPIVIILWIFGI